MTNKQAAAITKHRACIRQACLFTLACAGWHPARFKVPSYTADGTDNFFEPVQRDDFQPNSVFMTCNDARFILENAECETLLLDFVGETFVLPDRRKLTSQTLHSLSLLWQFATSLPAPAEAGKAKRVPLGGTAAQAGKSSHSPAKPRGAGSNKGIGGAA